MVQDCKIGLKHKLAILQRDKDTLDKGYSPNKRKLVGRTMTAAGSFIFHGILPVAISKEI